MSFLSLINGKFTRYISILDRGLAYGDGFFETMKWRICENNGNPKVEFGIDILIGLIKDVIYLK